jgi:hypothetical protein
MIVLLEDIDYGRYHVWISTPWCRLLRAPPNPEL